MSKKLTIVYDIYDDYYFIEEDPNDGEIENTALNIHRIRLYDINHIFKANKELVNDIMTNKFNCISKNYHDYIKFKNKEDAIAALEWIESGIIVEKISKSNSRDIEYFRW
ncbi:MAG: hypothetical protein ACOC2W_02255 [bacterium]